MDIITMYQWETSMIKQEAISRGCSIVMYGHTHKPVIEYDPHVIALNPGSLSYPRQKKIESHPISL